MRNIWHDISADRIGADNFIACIEIPKGGKIKYELDKETGLLMMDRVLYTSTHYPANYGFIPRTLADDDDPLDVLVLCSEKLVPLSIVSCYPIGVITMVDSGSLDEKIIAIPYGDPTYNSYTEIKDLPKHMADEMMHFFEVYKELEGKKTIIESVSGAEHAKEIIARYIENYNKIYGMK